MRVGMNRKGAKECKGFSTTKERRARRLLPQRLKGTKVFFATKAQSVGKKIDSEFSWSKELDKTLKMNRLFIQFPLTNSESIFFYPKDDLKMRRFEDLSGIESP